MPEEVHYSHLTGIPGLTLGTARFVAFRFAPHYHLDCHIALVASGVQRQSFRGESLFLTRRAIQLMPAGEVHDGVADADGSYTLQTFRLSPALLNGFGEEITGRHYFPSQAAAVLRDARLADRLLGMHATLQTGMSDPMLNETCVLELLESLFARLKQPSPKPFPERCRPSNCALSGISSRRILPTRSSWTICPIWWASPGSAS